MVNGVEEIDKEKVNEGMPRRDFFLLAGWGAFLVVVGGAILSGLRFIFPNVLFEPPKIFKLGLVDEYSEGSVSYVEEHQIFVLREEEGLKCVSAVCTHLGCTVTWDDAYGKFICPCHGSAFDRDGRVLKGAAPRPLDWFKVALTGDGRILVDKGQTVDSKYSYEV
jgi:cytochrome b6-f complex iron-sulfur subunit